MALNNTRGSQKDSIPSSRSRVPPFFAFTTSDMAEPRSSFPALRRLFFLLLQLACFVPSPPAASSSNQPLPPARRKVVSRSVSVRSYLRHLLSFSRSSNNKKQRPQSPERETLKQLCHYLVHPERAEPEENEPEQSEAQVDAAAGAAVKCRQSLACASCGELFFNKAELLELHRATKHAFSELPDGDPGNNIVRIIFQSGWKEAAAPPLIRRILKIHHSPSTLARFEKCRDAVRSRRGDDGGGEAERCAVDGNERLRFYCATFLCRLDGESAGTCGSPFCSVCWIVRQGFSGKEAAAEGGISTHATARAAHSSLPEDLEREFAFLRVRRAMLICRVLAGRHRPLEHHEPSAATVGEASSYDSAERAMDELIVFNPRAALPCFVVIYNWQNTSLTER